MGGIKGLHKLIHHAPHVTMMILGESLVKFTVEQGYWVAAVATAALGIPAITVYWLEKKGALVFARRRRKRRRS